MITDWLADAVSRHGMGLGLIAVFVGGLLLNLTPCVYPMIPVTLAFFSQQSSGTIRRTVGLALLYVLGLSLSYAALGAMAAKTGALFGSWLQSPFVIVGIALVVVALSLSMFGLYELRPPQAVMRRLGRASAGRWGAFAMGLTVGVVAAPCVGPFLVSLLLVISRMESPAAGFLLFFVLGMGMGAPSLILAVAAGRVGRMPKAGEWLVWSKRVLGSVLLIIALWLVKPVVPATLFLALLAALLAAAGVYLGWLDRGQGRGRVFHRVRRAVGVALIMAGVAVAWPRPPSGPPVAWQPYTTQALEAALRRHQPVIVDIYADWCLPCVELDRVTLRHPDVAQALGRVAPLRLDVTRDVSEDGEILFQHYQVYGVPTVLFFDTAGVQRSDLRVSGFIPPGEFLRRVRQLQ